MEIKHEYKIERTPLISSHQRTKYPWSDLGLPEGDLYDSFFVPCANDDPGRKKLRSNLSTAAFAHGKRLGRRFTLRTLKDGFRLFRVE